MSNQFKQKFDLFVENCTVPRIKDLDWGCKVNDNTDLGKVGARACPWSFYDVIAQMPLWIISVSCALFHSCGFSPYQRALPLLSALVSDGQLLLLLLLLPVVRCSFWALPVGFSRPWAGNSFLMLLSSWLLHLPHLVTWLLHCLCNHTSILIILYLNA